MKEDMTKLPVWARQRITKLMSDVEFYKKQVGEITNDNPVVSWKHLDDTHGIPTDARVHIKTTMGVIEVSLKHRDFDYIEIYSAGGTLSVIPWSTNVLHVQVIER